jgi:hypothetical protein
MCIHAYAEHTKPSVPTMTIDYTGNVGIGIAIPQKTLDVRDVRASGALSIAGYSDVKITDGQPTLTSLSDITTGSIAATGLTHRGGS